MFEQQKINYYFENTVSKKAKTKIMNHLVENSHLYRKS